MELLKIYSETSTPGEVIIDDTWYSPGVVGFLATFGLAAVSLFIIWDLVRRIRRVRYRAEISELLDKEQLGDKPIGNSEPPTTPEKPLS